MLKFTIKLEPEEHDALCKDLIDMAIMLEHQQEEQNVILRILQLLLRGQWRK